MDCSPGISKLSHDEFIFADQSIIRVVLGHHSLVKVADSCHGQIRSLSLDSSLQTMFNGDSPSNLYSDTKLSNYLVALRTSGGQASCHVASLITSEKFQDALFIWEIHFHPNQCFKTSTLYNHKTRNHARLL